MVRRENIPTLTASDWSAVRIYPRFLNKQTNYHIGRSIKGLAAKRPSGYNLKGAPELSILPTRVLAYALAERVSVCACGRRRCCGLNGACVEHQEHASGGLLEWAHGSAHRRQVGTAPKISSSRGFAGCPQSVGAPKIAMTLYVHTR